MPRGARGNADLVTRRSVLWIDEWLRWQPKDPSAIDASANKSSEAGETRRLRIRSDPFPPTSATSPLVMKLESSISVLNVCPPVA
jgi:hypothetical protein